MGHLVARLNKGDLEMSPNQWTWLALLLTAVLPASAQASEVYFVVLFGSQRSLLNRPNYSHTFATFVKMTGPGAGFDPTQPHWIECFTISWLPATGDIFSLRRHPECGRNWDFEETMQLVQEQKQEVAMWGPYQIQPELFCRAVAQFIHLENDSVRFKAWDTGFPAEKVSNCIHAVGDLAGDTARTMRNNMTGWGNPASYFVTLSLWPWLIDPNVTHPWVADDLGLGRYCLIPRDLSSYPPGCFLQRHTLAIFHPDLLKVREDIIAKQRHF
jgi:hypothetical protein